MPYSIQILILIATTIYQVFSCFLEDQKPPIGNFVKVGKSKLHYYIKGENKYDRPTIILDHSLGGIEGYLLIDELAKFTKVLIYDRAGYSWSDNCWQPRTSQQIVNELDTLLTKAEIKPPYILVGDSFGSYNMRLFAYLYPDKIAGLVLTDGLHESGMLNLPFLVKGLKLVMTSGFFISIFGASFGIIRVIKTLGLFELFKPNLGAFSPENLNYVKRSFCRPKHWITMTREMMDLDTSGRQVSLADDLGDLPIVNIKAKSFFHRSWWTFLIPFKSIEQVRTQIHLFLLELSTDIILLEADCSSHFVWVDQPEIMVEAMEILLEKINKK